MSQFTENISIEKVIAHSIPAGRGSINDLILSTSCISLNEDAKRALRLRLTQTMDTSSKSLMFEFTDTSANSAFEKIRDLIVADEPDFIEMSKDLARKLNEASRSSRIPACLMIIIQGTTGAGTSAHKVLYILRAEPQNGFKKVVSDNVVTLELIDELFLSKSQKMFKAAAIAVSGDNEHINRLSSSFFKCLVYDENFVLGNISTSAKYFTKDFLGCDIPNDSKRKLMDFFNETKAFVNQAPLLNADQVRNIIDALTVEIRSESEIVNYNDFANQHIPQRIRELYLDKMREILGEQASFRKDRSYVEKMIDKRAVEFDNGVIIRYSAEDGDDAKIVFDEENSNDEYTVIKIRSRMKKYT